MKEQDFELKRMLEEVRIKASENLKDRILHQIESEKALIPQERNTKNNLAEYFEILIIGYFVSMLLGGYYWHSHKEITENTLLFIYMIIAILSLTSVLGLFILWKNIRGKALH